MPTPRHIFIFLLAAFIDIIIFLLAYASGPHLAGSQEHRMMSAAASIEALDGQVFTRDLLRKVIAAPGGLARLDRHALSPGEQQFPVMLAGRGQAPKWMSRGAFIGRNARRSARIVGGARPAIARLSCGGCLKYGNLDMELGIPYPDK